MNVRYASLGIEGETKEHKALSFPVTSRRPLVIESLHEAEVIKRMEVRRATAEHTPQARSHPGKVCRKAIHRQNPRKCFPILLNKPSYLQRINVTLLRCSTFTAAQPQSRRLLEIPSLQLQRQQVNPKADLRSGERGIEMESSLIRGH